MRSPVARRPSSLYTRLFVVLSTVLVSITWAPRAGGQQPSIRVFAVSGSPVVAAAAEVDRMLGDGRLDLAAVDSDTMLDGRTHERLLQRVNGVRVFGAELVRQMDGNAPVSVFGAL